MIGNDFTRVNRSTIADQAGRQVLGISGSLSGYINTGNKYNRDYFVSSRRIKTRKQKLTAAQKRNRVLTAIGATVAVATSLAMGKKGFTKLGQKLKAGFNKIVAKKDNAGKKVGSFFKKLFKKS